MKVVCFLKWHATFTFMNKLTPRQQSVINEIAASTVKPKVCMYVYSLIQALVDKGLLKRVLVSTKPYIEVIELTTEGKAAVK